jgi:hypothetical protein
VTEISFTNMGPAKLYAILLKLRPLERGTIMPFSGELVHGAWLDWIGSATPDVVTMLHDGNKRRLFTCSSLQFPILVARLRQAERENVHLPLDPEKTYTIRITLLLGELFPLFYNTLMHFNMTEIGAKKSPFIQIGKQMFLLENNLVKILSTYVDSFTVARHAVVVCPSMMPRQMAYNAHDASQALANSSNNSYTNLRVQITHDRVITIHLPRKLRIGVASQAYRGIRRRQRNGFASAIETDKVDMVVT